MASDRDTDTGKFEEKYPRELFIEAVEELETPTTSNVAEQVGCSYGLAYRRLKDLAENREIEKTIVGKTFVWSLKER